MKKYLIFLTISIFLYAVALPGFSAAPKGEDEENLMFAYVCKMLTDPWFINEENGIRASVEELWIDYMAVDADMDDTACMKAVDDAIEQGADALMIVVTQQFLGPAVVEKCREVDIPVITIDVTIKDNEGNQVPHVGSPSVESGKMGGHVLAKLAKERSFFAPGNVVKVMQIDMSFRSVMHDRTVGYRAALMEDLPLKDSDFIVQDNKTGGFEENLTVARAILNTNPDVTHWLVTGINDQGAIAPLRIFEEQGFPIANVLACGLGGSKMSFEEFQKPHNSYIVTRLQPFTEGETAVQILFDYITEDTPMPETTLIPGVIITKENYTDFEFAI